MRATYAQAHGNYILSTGKPVELNQQNLRMDVITADVVDSQRITTEIDETVQHNGHATTKCTYPAGESAASIWFTGFGDMVEDFSRTRQFGFYVRMHGPFELGQTVTIQLYVYDSSGSAKLFRSTVLMFASDPTTDAPDQDQWIWVGGHADEKQDASIAFETVNRIRVSVQFSTVRSNDFVFHMSEFTVRHRARPKIIFLFDDSVVSQYEIAFPVLQSYGIPMNIAWIGKGDRAGFITDAQGDEIYDAGGALLNHTNDVENLVSGNPEDGVAGAIAGGRQYLLDRGWLRGADHLVYPGGSSNSAVIAAAKAAGSRSGLKAGADEKGFFYAGPLATESVWSIPRAKLDSAVDGDGVLTNRIAAIDAAITRGANMITMLHGVVAGAGPTTANQVTENDLAAMAAHVAMRRSKQGLIDTPDYGSWFDGLTRAHRGVGAS